MFFFFLQIYCILSTALHSMRLLLQSLLRNFKIIEKDGGTAYLCEYKDTLYDKEFNQMNLPKTFASLY